MIDIHVHCRDWEWKHKETIEHALQVAENVGLSGIFDMPNTLPVITTPEVVEYRLNDARKFSSPVFYGLYMGLTPDIEQVKQAVECYRKYFPKPGDNEGVVGLKLFAGKSVGDLSVSKPKDQYKVYGTLGREGYEGVLAVHCEEETLMEENLWEPGRPITHLYSRPDISEFASISQQLTFAYHSGFLGNLHICHVSLPESVELINNFKHNIPTPFWSSPILRISCGVTPHHLLLSAGEMHGANGILYKVNPPLRGRSSRENLFRKFLEGNIDILESDHAPHTLEEKTNPPYLSGIPNLASWPIVFQLLKKQGATDELIHQMMHSNVNRIFGFDFQENSLHSQMTTTNHLNEYAFEPYKNLT